MQGSQLVWLGISAAAALGVTGFAFAFRAEQRLRASYPELYGHTSTPASRVSFARLLLLTFRDEWRHHPDLRVRRFVVAYRMLFVLWACVPFLPLLIVHRLAG